MKIVKPTSTLACLVVAALAVCSHISAAQSSSPDEAALRNLEKRIPVAWVKKDRVALEQILGSEWSVVTSAGAVVTRAMAFDSVFNSKVQTMDTQVIDNVTVAIYGSSAVVRGVAAASGTFQGAPFTAKVRFTDFCIKRDGRWQVIASHQSQLN